MKAPAGASVYTFKCHRSTFISPHDPLASVLQSCRGPEANGIHPQINLFRERVAETIGDGP
jgi:hypothetical protein